MSGDVLTLKGGVRIERAALHLALDLELKGVKLRLVGDDLVANPRGRVTAEETRLLGVHIRDLKALVDYCARSESVQ